MTQNQTTLIKELAEKHGITYKQAFDIFDQLGQCIFDTMVNHEKDEKGKPILKTIHIDRFGKFIPKAKKFERYFLKE